MLVTWVKEIKMRSSITEPIYVTYALLYVEDA